MPNLTLYLDLDPQIGLSRIRKNKGREVNRLDLEEISFHLKVRDGYEEVIKRFPDRIVRVDANQELDKVFLDTKQILLEKLKLED